MAKKSAEIEHLKQSLDSLEQKQREQRVRITGIPEEEGENLTKKLLDLAKKKIWLKKLKDTDIVEIYRSGKQKIARTRDVIVQFESKLTRDSLYIVPERSFMRAMTMHTEKFTSMTISQNLDRNYCMMREY